MNLVTSHNAHDYNRGLMVCPTIQEMQCQYCRQTGHAKSHCKQYKKDWADSVKTPEPKKGRVSTPSAPTKAPPSNKYSVLDVSDDEDEVAIPRPQVRKKINWADYDSDSDSD